MMSQIKTIVLSAECVRHRSQSRSRRIAVTEGIVRILDLRELRGVLAMAQSGRRALPRRT